MFWRKKLILGTAPLILLIAYGALVHNNYSNIHKNFIRNISAESGDSSGYLNFYWVPDSNIHVYNVSAFTVNINRIYTIIIGFENQYKTSKIHCQLRYSDGSVLAGSTEIERMSIWVLEKGFKYLPVFIKCLEKTSIIPVQVRIVTDESPENESSSWIAVRNRRHHTSPAKSGLAICQKTIFNYTSVWALAEWMETHRLLGVDKVILYGYNNISVGVHKLLQHYVNIGFLHIQPWNYSWPLVWEIPYGREKHDVMLNNLAQTALINDCLYRFGHYYRHLAMLDTDEYIIASNKKEVTPLPKLISQYPDEAAIYFVHHRFCIKSYIQKAREGKLLTLQTRRRTGPSRYSPYQQAKVILKASEICHCAIHFIPAYIKSPKFVTFPVEKAKLHHYRFVPKFKDFYGSGSCSTKDDSMVIPFQEVLPNNVRKAIKQANCSFH